MIRSSVELGQQATVTQHGQGGGQPGSSMSHEPFQATSVPAAPPPPTQTHTQRKLSIARWSIFFIIITFDKKNSLVYVSIKFHPCLSVLKDAFVCFPER